MQKLRIRKKATNPWRVKGEFIEEWTYGALFEALQSALEMAIVESGYPKEMDNPRTVTIAGRDAKNGPIQVTLTLCYQKDEVKNV